MTSAQRTALPLDPMQALDIVFRMSRRLVDDLGVTITFADIPHGDVADFDDGTRILRIAPSATLTDQLYAYEQVTKLLVYGEDMAHGVIPAPMLSLVPAPRRPTGND